MLRHAHKDVSLWWHVQHWLTQMCSAIPRRKFMAQYFVAEARQKNLIDNLLWITFSLTYCTRYTRSLMKEALYNSPGFRGV